MTSQLDRRNQTILCDFHKEVGHTTDTCHALKLAIEHTIQQGQLREYVQVSHFTIKPVESYPKIGTTLPHIINVISNNSYNLSFPPHKRLRLSETNEGTNFR